MTIRSLVILAAAGLLAACGSSEKAQEAYSTPVSGVQIETTRLQTIQEFYEAAGTVRSATISVLSAQISGTVLEMRVKAGDRMRRGQLLAVLDDRSPRAQLGAAEAGVEEVTQGLAEVEQAQQAAAADRQFAEATYRRYQGLLEKNSLSRQEFEGAEARYKAALANEGALQAKKKQILARSEQARAQQESAHTVFTYSRIISPIDGVVTAKSVDAGTVVMPGTPLLTLEETSHYRLEANLPERYLPKVSLGMLTGVTIGHSKIDGRVVEIVPAADVASRTFLVKVALPPDCGCLSGEYGTASFAVGEGKRLTVPRSAIIERGELEGLFIVSQQGRVEYRLVKTGRQFGDRAEILSGLAENERVATTQLDRLGDGARVEEP
ncbi:MAG: efflux RND transporter periplasmic adaptor subunit [Terriglobia bacterium]